MQSDKQTFCNNAQHHNSLTAESVRAPLNYFPIFHRDSAVSVKLLSSKWPSFLVGCSSPGLLICHLDGFCRHKSACDMFRSRLTSQLHCQVFLWSYSFKHFIFCRPRICPKHISIASKLSLKSALPKEPSSVDFLNHCSLERWKSSLW